jgi:hypothetical protein
MKLKITRPSPAMVVASLALFLALGGSALGYGLGRESERSNNSDRHARYTLRSGKIVDKDTTTGDGSFNYAQGHARCKQGERLISGGVRLRSGAGVFPGQHVSMVESGPVPKQREWTVALNSDLGGAARQDFVVFAYCLSG